MDAQIKIRGTVSTGMGEGRYFMSIAGYEIQLNAALGFHPYPGTLNLKLEGEELGKLKRLKEMPGITIKGFSSPGKTFGDVMCYVAVIRGLQCAIVIPLLSRHTDVLEVIAKDNLRDELGLSDGMSVEVIVKPDPREAKY